MRSGTIVVAALALALLCASSSPGAVGVTLFVTSDQDDASLDGSVGMIDDGVCDAVCTLREAIARANATTVKDEIKFAIAPGGNQTIVLDPLSSPVGLILTAPVRIDGFSQQTITIDCHGAVGIGLEILPRGSRSNVSYFEIEGCTSAGLALIGKTKGVAAFGLTLTGNAVGAFFSGGAAKNTLGAGQMSDNGTGIYLTGAQTSGNLISSNYVGTDAAGMAALANTEAGIVVDAPKNKISGNLVSGNEGPGITLTPAAAGGVLETNKIGVNILGAAAIPNETGLDLAGPKTLVGNNVVSGNTGPGLLVESSGNTFFGNRIGTSVQGNSAIPNTGYGVHFTAGPNVFGVAGSTPNLVSGNAWEGIEIQAPGIAIQNAYVGMNIDGTAAIPNGNDGISIDAGASTVLIGGRRPSAGNLISGNTNSGISVSVDGVLILNNTIGANLARTAARPNGDFGVNLSASFGVVSSNLIAGNTLHGINLDGDGNLVQRNVLGDDLLGFGNGGDGIEVQSGAVGNRIGGMKKGEGNTIEANGGNGVQIVAADANGNAILGNGISGNTGLGIELGTDGDGVTANDADDSDTGPNNLQNFPLVTAIGGPATAPVLTFDFGSTPSTSYRIEFFGSTGCDGSGYGEGEVFLGAVTVQVGVSGGVTGAIAKLRNRSSLPQYSATATNLATGDTSELSQCLP